MKKLTFLICCLFLLLSCKKNEKLPPIDQSKDLDGSLISDSSLIEPAKFLLSAAIPFPTSTDLQKKVIIAVHGFSASNFEWQEFSSWAKTKPDILVSRVLLGGHGRDFKDFKDAKWFDWQQPVIEEFKRLKELGYQNIYFAASSTGCPLVLNALNDKKVTGSVIKKVFFIDPIVVPSNKMLPLVTVLGGSVIKYTETTLEAGEHGYWYRYRPHEALNELNTITKKTRKALEKGIKTENNLKVVVYKSEHDGAADPVSAVLLEKGLNNCEVKMIDSDLHVFTRLKGRNTFTDKDRYTQQNTFEEIYKSL